MNHALRPKHALRSADTEPPSATPNHQRLPADPASARRRPRIVGLGGSLREGSTSLTALRAALAAAHSAGARTELLALHELDLPMYKPNQRLTSYPRSVHHVIEAVRRADAMIWSSPGYHGTISGALKNALDFLQFLADDDPPYLSHRTVGLITTAGGHPAAVNAANAMAHAAHALRARLIPQTAPIGRAAVAFSEDGSIADPFWKDRLHGLGTSATLSAEGVQRVSGTRTLAEAR